MLNMILLGGGIATVSGVIGFFISKKLTSANFEVYTDQAKAKAKAIENEAQTLLERAHNKSREIELEAKKQYESAKERAKANLHQREDDLIRKEQSFKRYKQDEEKKIHSENSVVESKKLNLERNEKSLNSLKNRYEEKIDEALHVLEHSAGMTKDEAKTALLQNVEEKSRGEIAHIVRRYESEAKQEGERKAN
ncbi:MAG: ribonuclease Y, partial [Bacteroidetes bacterium]